MRRAALVCVLVAGCAGLLALVPSQAQVKTMPWKLGQKYTVRYSANNQPVGGETFVITKIKQGGKDAYQLQSDVELKQGNTTVWKSNVNLITDLNMQPLSYKAQISVQGQQANIEATFTPGKVKEKVTGAQNVEREIQLPKPVYVMDNNLTGSLALLGPALQYKVGSEIKAPAFFPSIMQQIPLTLKVVKTETVTVGNRKVECYQCLLQVANAQINLWMDKEGRLVKGQQGPVTYVVE